MMPAKPGPGTERGARARSVFTNCPFDDSYKPMFEAIVFAVIALGFDVRSALSRDTGTEERLTKITTLIEEWGFGVHDLSFMRIDPGTRLPRYNMAFELGLFLGCCEYGRRKQTGESCLILDRQKWRYRKSLSDVSGRDVQAHGGKPSNAIKLVRDWLATESRMPKMPGGEFVVSQYRIGSFRSNYPSAVRRESGTGLR